MKNITSGKVSIGFATTLFVFIINAVVAYQSISIVTENNRAEAASNRVLNVLVKMLSKLKDIELGQRDYLLTNNPQYLAAHRLDIAQIRTQSNLLVALKSGADRQSFTTQIDRHLSELLDTVDRRQAKVLTPARQLQLSQRGQQSIEQIRQLTTSLDRAERTRLDRLQSQSSQSLNDTKVAFAIAGLLDLLLLAFLYGLVGWDFTKKQQAESTLRDYVAEFEELYHNAPCGYHSLDATGKVTRINRTELEMLGYQEAEIISQLVTQIGIALTQAQLLAQEQLQRQELARSNTELEQFAHIASHDLQEPLRMVISYLQLLSRRYQGKLDPDADEFIEYAVDGAVRMQALIQALLSYARISSRKQPFELVKCDVVVQDAISNLYVAISESGAIISCDSLPEVWGDATQLTQVFQNLIANAIKFRRELPPKIQISARPLNPHLTPRINLNEPPTEEIAAIPSDWCFAVADNGIGIEPQYLDRIFVIFQRLYTRVTYPGTGIGLAICKKIIERHGGTIWVESTPIRPDSMLQQPLPLQSECYGSIFYFTIPAESNISVRHDHKHPHH